MKNIIFKVFFSIFGIPKIFWSGENAKKNALKWGFSTKIRFLIHFLQFWVPSARFICKNTTFQKNTFSLGWSWNFDLFWGPQEPYGSFRYQNSRNMYNYDIISYVIKLLQVKYAAKFTVLVLQKCYAPKKWMPECPRESEVDFNTTCAMIRV